MWDFLWMCFSLHQWHNFISQLFCSLSRLHLVDSLPWSLTTQPEERKLSPSSSIAWKMDNFAQIRLKLWRRFPSFRHESTRQTGPVTHRLKSIPHFSVELRTECCAVWRSTQFLWCWWQASWVILMTVEKRSDHLDLLEKACHAQFCERWQWIVRNEQLISWGPGQFWSKCTSVWLLMSFSFVTCTDNCFGETLQLETSDQTNKNCWQLLSCWPVVGPHNEHIWQWYDFTRDSNHEWKSCPEF